MRKLFTIFLILAWLPLANASIEDDLKEATNARTSKDYKKALSIWKPLAEQGNVEAQRNLASMHYTGSGVSQDFIKASEWFRKAAEQGDIRAQTTLGYLHGVGWYDGIPKNLKKSFKWYKRAAEQGDKSAQDIIGLMYFYGNGVDQNYNEAEAWYKKSAEQGHAKAQFKLGDYIYETAEGDKEKLMLSYMWISIVAKNDGAYSDDARKLLQVIRKDMVFKDISKAEKLVTQCWESKYKNCGE